MIQKRKDNFFLFTLIDFLLQSIFVGLFVFFLSRQTSDQSLPSDLISKIKQAGPSIVAELIDTSNKLVPIDRLAELVVLLDQFTTIEDLKKALEVLKKLGKEGVDIVINAKKEKLDKSLANIKGTPACFPNQNGHGEFLFRIAGYDEYYEIEGITPSGYEALKKSFQILEEGQRLTSIELNNLGKSIKSAYPSCLNFVYYDAMVDRISLEDSVNNWFIALRGKRGYK